jgi:hypothetical protein
MVGEPPVRGVCQEIVRLVKKALTLLELVDRVQFRTRDTAWPSETIPADYMRTAFHLAGDLASNTPLRE